MEKNLQAYRTGSDISGKSGIVLDKQQRRAERQDELFYLDTGKNVDIVERFVPDIQVRPFAEAAGKRRFLSLSRAHLGKLRLKFAFVKAEFV